MTRWMMEGVSGAEGAGSWHRGGAAGAPSRERQWETKDTGQ